LTNFPGSVRYPSHFRQLGTLTLPEPKVWVWARARAPSALPKAVEERNPMFWDAFPETDANQRTYLFMTGKPKILITGATDQVGKGVIPYLTADPSVEVIAAVRSPKMAAHLGIFVVYLDLDQVDTMAPALKGIDRLFVVTGYTIETCFGRARIS
jgi:hypothetical protein